MEHIYADKTVSISEFKREMAEVFRKAGGAPIAVLKNNKPDFYVLTPELFEVVVDVLDDYLMRDEVLTRHRSGDFTEVELEEL